MYDSQDDGMCLARAADIIRDDLFAKFPAFNGHFDSNYVHASVPKSLVFLVHMLLEGPHFMKNCPVDAGCDSTDDGDDVAVNIAQLIRYNSTKKMRDGGERSHSLDRETPLPVYVGLLLHTKTRKAGLVNKLSRLGLCISYDTVCDMKESIASYLCKEYEERKLVQPASMKDGLFTTAAIDNIDHNVMATSAQQHFHGTNISLFQHSDQSALANAITINITDKSNLTNKLMLPEYYLNIEPVNKGNVTRPMSSINTRDGENTYFPLEENSAWLEKSELIIIDDDQQDMDTKLSWSAFCQGEESSTTRPKVLSALMPLIDENINSMAMVKHTMKIIKKSS